MKMRCSLHSLIILSLTAVLSSCGGGNSIVNKAFSTNAVLSEEHPLSNLERNIATRICYAYQSKSNNFRSSEFLGKTFLFSAKKTDCKNKTMNYVINSILKFDSNNFLIYSPVIAIDPALDFNGKVQTDTIGYLAQLCPKIIRNEEISNTSDQSGVKVQISFSHDKFDAFFLQYFIKQLDNSYKIDSAQKFQVRTQIDYNTGQILGMDESYTTQKICTGKADANPFSVFEQNYQAN